MGWSGWNWEIQIICSEYVIKKNDFVNDVKHRIKTLSVDEMAKV